MILRCIAVDDEKLALDLLEDNIRRTPFLQLVRRCRNAFEAIEALEQEQIDLIFLDIQMPGLTGIQLLQSRRSVPMVIFITAYERYAVEGFNLDVVDYLVKPMAYERFVKAAGKALEMSRLRQNLPQQPAPPPQEECIFVHSEYNLVRVDFKDILYVEGLKDYIKIHIESAPRPVITRLSMKAIEEKFSPDAFIRVHKSFIVARSKITSLRKNRVFLGQREIPISEMYKEELYRWIGGLNVGRAES
ncbi:MAG: DNA-binding response regulator [Bacteroidetes bacterium]|nr:MAG: DNA-binding response regulator [Bacteroidota bacterium]